MRSGVQTLSGLRFDGVWRSVFAAVTFTSVVGSVVALEVPSIFGNHVVLQRGEEIPVWGKAADGVEVTVQMAGETRRAVAEDGRWRVDLPAMEGGGPYQLRIAGGGKERIFKDVLVGEVWVLAGQSNMRWQLGRTATVEASEAIAGADGYSQIRYFEPAYAAADRPEFDVKNGRWLVASAATAPRLSTVGYYFARKLVDELGVPVGLVQTAVGGTKARSWLSREVLKSDERLAEILPEFEREALKERERFAKLEAKFAEQVKAAKAAGKSKPNAPKALARGPLDETSDARPSGYYYGRVSPLQPMATRGVIWYQGESNSSGGLPAYQRETYGAQLGAVVSSWRSDWGRADLPFFIVQLPAYGDEAFDEPLIRSFQEKVARESENVGLVVGIDTGEVDDIHPGDKMPISMRLAEMALRYVAMGKVVTASPLFDRAEVVDGAVMVAFDQVGGGLVNTQFTLDEFVAVTRNTDPETLPVMGFEIAGADGEFEAAEARIEGERVRVWSERVAEPRKLRYLWRGFPEEPVGLYTRAGDPVAPFRWSAP